jgi:hypothetical protein
MAKVEPGSELDCARLLELIDGNPAIPSFVRSFVVTGHKPKFLDSRSFVALCGRFSTVHQLVFEGFPPFHAVDKLGHLIDGTILRPKEICINNNLALLASVFSLSPYLKNLDTVESVKLSGITFLDPNIGLNPDLLKQEIGWSSVLDEPFVAPNIVSLMITQVIFMDDQHAGVIADQLVHAFPSVTELYLDAKEETNLTLFGELVHAYGAQLHDLSIDFRACDDLDELDAEGTERFWST